MNQEDYLPKQGITTKSFWDSENDPFRKLRSTPDLPTSADVLIVGSGFSGSSLAYYLSQYEKPPVTVLLEARDICAGATGRNGGHLKPEYYRHNIELEAKYGVKEAAAIGNFEYDNYKAVRELIGRNGIDCDFIETRSFNCHVSENSANDARRNYRKYMDNQYVKTKGLLQHLDGEQAEVVSEVKGTKFAVSFPAAHLWPYKLVKALLQMAIDKKPTFLNVQSNTPVTRIEKLYDGTYVVRTTRGDVYAKKVVLATNAYTPALQKELTDKIIPVKGTVSRIIPLDTSGIKTKYAPYLTNTYGVFYDDHYEYLINRPDGSIVVGGAEQTYEHDIDSWYKNTDDSTLFSAPVREFYEDFMQGTYHSWKHTDSDVDYLWTGIMGFSADRLPFVGEVPGEANKYVTAGFHGHGMPRVLLCSKAISECIMEGKKIQDTDVPKSFILSTDRLESTENKVLETSFFVTQQQKGKL